MKRKGIIILGMFYHVIGLNCINAQQNPTVTDIEGNIYKTVTIGNQLWMAENLKVKKLNDGTEIPLVTNASEWKNANMAFCWYPIDSSIFILDMSNELKNIGLLYTWHVVNTDKLCPIGWHVPSKTDWETLSAFLGGSKSASTKLKRSWSIFDKKSTNETGFSAMPSGHRGFNGIFYMFGKTGYWWCSMEHNKKRHTIKV